jgi:hypothetical protein
MQYAKLNLDKTEITDWIDTDSLPPHKAGYILPVIVDAMPEYNSETQQIIDGDPVIEADKVRKTWQIVDIIIPIPDEIPLWAFRTSIRKSGLKESVEFLLNSLPEPQKTDALEHYEYGNFIVRSHPLIIQLSSALGLTSNQVDDIFITGSLLI